MPPAVGLAAGAINPVALVGTALGGGAQAGADIYNIAEQGNAAKRARRGAQAAYEEALRLRPQITGINDLQAGALQRLYDQAIAPMANYSPTYVSPELEASFLSQLEGDATRQRNQNIQQLNELQARRGTFRSGVGAQQTAQALTDLNQNLLRAQTQARLGFNEQRANEQARAFELNLAANQQRAGQLGGILDEANRRTAQQQLIFSEMMRLAGQAGAGAGAAQQGYSQAISNFGQNIGNLGAAAIYGASGGFPGGAGGYTRPANTALPTNVPGGGYFYRGAYF